MPPCLTLIALRKALITVETEAVLEALGNQGTDSIHQDISNFTTRISPFCDDITIDVRRRVRQGDTVSPKLFSATLEDVMRTLEWDNMGVRVDDRLLPYLRFANDIVLITYNKSEAERMLANFDDACGKSPTESNEDNVHEERMGPGCPILVQRNDHLRMLQLRVSRSGSQHDERPRSRAGQEEARGLGSL
ncbi:hypothetical protein ANCCEY_10820 [Ancylostoma ceylanicum]|uniref:Reverse transcriptase domain-containing protein n=1 Tax=Ancylostoma ceylanicum TaxID=53326 RepID=A0A0D6LDT4_9BILA|nr:hypothetical protein ANCCEY_10820 [Ancylostoma ceylanicum]